MLRVGDSDEQAYESRSSPHSLVRQSNSLHLLGLCELTSCEIDNRVVLDEKQHSRTVDRETSLASAWLTDRITFRVLGDRIARRAVQPDMHRLVTRQWIDEVTSHSTPDLSEKVAKPFTARELIALPGTAKWKPILWLEELDEIHLTQRAMDMLDDLVDAVTQVEGAIVITSNCTFAASCEKFRASFRRRVRGTGGNDPS